MRFDRNQNLAELDHGVLGRILRVVGGDASSLRGLGPVFLKYALIDPFGARASKRFGKNATIRLAGRIGN